MRLRQWRRLLALVLGLLFVLTLMSIIQDQAPPPPRIPSTFSSSVPSSSAVFSSSSSTGSSPPQQPVSQPSQHQNQNLQNHHQQNNVESRWQLPSVSSPSDSSSSQQQQPQPLHPAVPQQQQVTASLPPPPELQGPPQQLHQPPKHHQQNQQPSLAEFQLGAGTLHDNSDATAAPATTAMSGFDPSSAAVLILTHNRPEHLRRCLQGLIRSRQRLRHHHPELVGQLEARSGGHPVFPVIVSQDGSHPGVNQVLQEQAPGELWRVVRHQQVSFPRRKGWETKYWILSNHFKDLLGAAFDGTLAGMRAGDQYRIDSIESPDPTQASSGGRKIQHLIVIEDDLELAEDFLEYFWAMGEVMDKDPSLICVSAWNDNGRLGLIGSPSEVRRTDFFPGLGWMLSAHTFRDITHSPGSQAPGWPNIFWDDWLRHPIRRRDRQCLFPEVSRTKHSPSVQAASAGQFDRMVNTIHLNTEYVRWLDRRQHLAAELSPQGYAKSFTDRLLLGQVLTTPKLGGRIPSSFRWPPPAETLQGLAPGQPLVVEYTGDKDYDTKARAMGLLHDLRAGVPRCGYRGVVKFHSSVLGGREIFLVPAAGVDLYVRCTPEASCQDGPFY